jgi:putative methionine-R-sulfoxide reductase with GAF domain
MERKLVHLDATPGVDRKLQEKMQMSSEGMDQNPEILEPDTVAAGMDAGAREWPGVTKESERTTVKFPGEDGGRSLGKMAERDLDAALQLLAERAQYITGATGAAIALRDGDEMVCRASAGGSAPEIGARLQMDSGLSGESIRTRQMLRCDDAQADGRVNKESCEALGIASVVVMPMVDAGEVIGVFELFSDRTYAFEERDITALERMGAMVRTAIEQVEVAGGEVGGATMVGQVAPTGEGQALHVTQVVEPDAQALIVGEGNVEENLTLLSKPSLEEAEVELVDKGVPEQLAAGASSGTLDDSRLSEMDKDEEKITPVESARKVETPDPDIGEMARDAAARTAAFKASLFERETPAVSEGEAGKERIAFHIRVPVRKTDLMAVETELAEAPAALASVEGERGTTKWETPILEEVATPHGVSVPQEDRTGPAATGVPTAIATGAGSAAAAAPAKQAPGFVSVMRAEAKAAETVPPTAAATTPAIQGDVPRAKPEVARPASAEGRSRIAVSQVRKCEACGFPVSEGRKLCLDCEKKKPQESTATGSANAATAVAEGFPPQSTKIEAVAAGPAAVTTRAAQAAALEAAAEEPAIVEKMAPATPQEAIQEKPTKLEAKHNDAAPAAREPVVEPPAPHFMVGAPDHYESWIVSHMYTAVAIAVVVVGIVVYLLSR